MNTLYYIFDPLCGWCYCASSIVTALAGAEDVRLELLPSGLFREDGARSMDDDFAAFVRSRMPALLRFGHALTGNRHDALDLVQTALARGSRDNVTCIVVAFDKE